MTDDELLAMLREKYPALYDELTRRGYSCEAAALADLRRLMAYCRTDVMVAAALQQSPEEEK